MARIDLPLERAARESTARSLPAAAMSSRENILVLWHIYTATGALALGALFGLLQGFSRKFHRDAGLV